MAEHMVSPGQSEAGQVALVLNAALADLAEVIEQTRQASSVMEEVMSAAAGLHEDTRHPLVAAGAAAYRQAGQQIGELAARLGEGQHLVSEYLGILLGAPARSGQVVAALDALGGSTSVGRSLRAAGFTVTGLRLEQIEAVRAVSSGRTGAWTRELNRPGPLLAYIVDDTSVYLTDGRSRPVQVRASLDQLATGAAIDERRNGYQQATAGGADRLPGDQGGHLIASRFHGPGEAINLTPMARELNGPGTDNWYAMEARFARSLAQDSPAPIEVTITQSFPGESRRPRSLDVEFTDSRGIPERIRFRNRRAAPAPEKE